MLGIFIVLLLPFALTFFLPFRFVFWGMAFCCAAIGVLLGLGSLYAFDITDPEDWKMLFVSLILPGIGAVALYFIGKLFGDMVLMDVVHMIFR
ncbi:MAG: hypothetical protein IJN69_07605 [Oscillospiraceae bacterium]|nr:hypothetical protein [Oscillospiraceae bacterium]